MSDTPKPDPRQFALVSAVSMALTLEAATLCQATIEFSKMGGTLAFLDGNETEDGKHRGVVLVLAGPIPKDLMDGLGNYLKGLLQDIKNEGGVTKIYDSTTSNDEPAP